jgi:transposase
VTKRKKRNRYTEQFKEEALRALETRGTRTIAEVAASLGVPEPLLHSWKSRAKTLSTANDRGESLQDEVRRLRRELADVKKDRDVLVKSIAVFVKERK